MYTVLSDLAPSSLATLFVRKRNITEYDLRGSYTSLQLPFPKTENLKKSFCFDGANLWNSLPADMRDSEHYQHSQMQLTLIISNINYVISFVHNCCYL